MSEVKQREMSIDALKGSPVYSTVWTWLKPHMFDKNSRWGWKEAPAMRGTFAVTLISFAMLAATLTMARIMGVLHS